LIWESQYWKEPLLKSASYLRRVRFSERTTERTFVRIEKELFLGFYTIRKLLDTFKVSDSTKEMAFILTYHPSIRQVDYLNWHHIDDNCDLCIHKTETRDIRFLCNQFVHSYVFLISESDGRIDGFFLASDLDKQSKCYFIDIEQVIKAFRIVGKDYPSQTHMQRDENGQWVGKVL